MILDFRGGMEREGGGITLPDFFNYSHLISLLKALLEVLFYFARIKNLTKKPNAV
jgi:hypothetical protein